MNFQQVIKRFTIVSCLVLSTFVFAAFSQTNGGPGVVYGPAKAVRPVVSGNNLYCAGYIQSNAISTENKIVGANDEADRYNYKQNDFLYINMGSNKGVNVGDTFAVVRPREPPMSKAPAAGSRAAKAKVEASCLAL